MTDTTPQAEKYLATAKATLLMVIGMNRAERRRAGWRAPVERYQAQLTRVLRDLGEIA